MSKKLKVGDKVRIHFGTEFGTIEDINVETHHALVRWYILSSLETQRSWIWIPCLELCDFVELTPKIPYGKLMR